jgi:UDP-glucose 4-epimerase
MSVGQSTILVTGGAGFVGSHLVELLATDETVTVISLDDYSTGLASNEVTGRSNVRYLHGSTSNISTIVDTVPSLLFHLGEYARVEQSMREPANVWASNLTGTPAVFEYCRRHGVPIVYASSSTRFAVGSDGKTLSPYTFSKATNTELIRLYHRWYGLRYAVAYLYNVYGPREIDDGSHATVIGIFRRRWLSGQSLIVNPPGTQLRNFTHVADAARGLRLIGRSLDRQTTHEYQLAHRRKYKIQEVAEMFPGATIEPGHVSAANRNDTALDLTAAESIGWKAEIQLEDYISAIVAER